MGPCFTTGWMDSANNNKQAAMSFFDELKRRNVYRVGVAYVIAGAAAHQEATRCLTRNVFRCGEIDIFCLKYRRRLHSSMGQRIVRPRSLNTSLQRNYLARVQYVVGVHHLL